MLENRAESYRDMSFFMQDVTEGWNVTEKENKKEFEKAYVFAKEVHKDQFRNEGTPYISHIDGIIDIMKDELNNLDYSTWTVIALHDVLEDSHYTYEDLKQTFDKYIADDVNILTKTKGLSIEEYISRMESYRYSEQAIEIKLADRLHNVRSLKNILELNKDKVLRYIDETEKHYIPLAQRHNKVLLNKLNKEIVEIKELLHGK